MVKRLANKQDIICVSTDDEEIRNVAQNCGINVPFLRPSELATDNAGTYEVIVHALNFYQSYGRQINAIVLLQPTSPFRQAVHVQEALWLYDKNLDAVVSVVETDANPYYVLFEESSSGFLEKSKTGSYVRRQDIPAVYKLNGAIYILNPVSLTKYKSIAEFPRKKKYIMDKVHSIDIDDIYDWTFAECMLKNGMVSLK